MNKPNFRRDRLNKEQLLPFLDQISISPRNKDIVRAYAAGASYAELSKIHQLSTERIAQIVSDGLRKLYRFATEDV